MHLPIQNASAETRRHASTQHYQAGPIAYIFKRGVLRIGVIMFVISTLYIYFVLHDHEAIYPPRVFISAPVCLLLGCLWGTYSWFQVKQAQRAK